METKVRHGMIVKSTSGISLGTVASTRPQFFVVEKGTYFPKDHELRYEGILEIRGNEILYRLSKERVAEGSLAVEKEKEEKGKGFLTADLPEGQELRVPLMEEQVIVEKSSQETGSVRIHKNVVAEERQVTVPIRREEVVVERRAAEQTTPGADAHPFEDERYSIPVHEEAFQVVTRPVVKEEVRVRRVTHEEQRSASARVRHEELEVEDDSHRLGSKVLDEEKKEV